MLLNTHAALTPQAVGAVCVLSASLAHAANCNTANCKAAPGCKTLPQRTAPHADASADNLRRTRLALQVQSCQTAQHKKSCKCQNTAFLSHVISLYKFSKHCQQCELRNCTLRTPHRSGQRRPHHSANSSGKVCTVRVLNSCNAKLHLKH